MKKTSSFVAIIVFLLQSTALFSQPDAAVHSCSNDDGFLSKNLAPFAVMPKKSISSGGTLFIPSAKQVVQFSTKINRALQLLLTSLPSQGWWLKDVQEPGVNNSETGTNADHVTSDTRSQTVAHGPSSGGLGHQTLSSRGAGDDGDKNQPPKKTSVELTDFVDNPARAFNNAGHAYTAQGNHAAAARAFNDAGHAYAAQGNHVAAARAFNDASVAFDNAVAAHINAGNDVTAGAEVRNNLDLVYAIAGAEARNNADLAHAAAAELTDFVDNPARAFNNAGHAYTARGNHAATARAFNDAGHAYAAQGNHVAAARAFNDASVAFDNAVAAHINAGNDVTTGAEVRNNLDLVYAVAGAEARNNAAQKKETTLSTQCAVKHEEIKSLFKIFQR